MQKVQCPPPPTMPASLLWHSPLLLTFDMTMFYLLWFMKQCRCLLERPQFQGGFPRSVIRLHAFWQTCNIHHSSTKWICSPKDPLCPTCSSMPPSHQIPGNHWSFRHLSSLAFFINFRDNTWEESSRAFGKRLNYSRSVVGAVPSISTWMSNVTLEKCGFQTNNLRSYKRRSSFMVVVWFRAQLAFLLEFWLLEFCYSKAFLEVFHGETSEGPTAFSKMSILGLLRSLEQRRRDFLALSPKQELTSFPPSRSDSWQGCLGWHTCYPSGAFERCGDPEHLAGEWDGTGQGLVVCSQGWVQETSGAPFMPLDPFLRVQGIHGEGWFPGRQQHSPQAPGFASRLSQCYERLSCPQSGVAWT